ncbi:plastocyanin/azurin family copper-binding protein [Halorussus halophilus]|uniref:plastocyanin/azurin family copper-binding protein n=1 Tax=Halorussus halophilus TaxID=2650975 RepID=UPI001300F87D|nr:plastocyanin/azurin family copper-binding protein [Halorussus halophilus]
MVGEQQAEGSRRETTIRSDSLSRREFLRTAGGATGAATAAAAGAETATAQQQTTIDMTDSLVFDPDETTVTPGTTVTWENVGSVGHSVTAYEDEIPDGAEYFASGGFDSEQAARNAYPDPGEIGGGETYQHTFDVEGTYGYFCIPHESAGMVAELTVSADAGGDGGDGEMLPTLPNSALVIGIATTVAMGFIVALAYFLLKYGGDYELE